MSSEHADEHVTLPAEPERPTEVIAPTPPAAPSPPPPASCAECRAELDPGQPYCLECGAPTPSAPKLRRRIGPAGVVALGLVALGGGAGALAYALAKDDDGTTAQTPTGLTTPTGPVLPPFGTDTVATTPSVDVTTGVIPPTTDTGIPPQTEPTDVTGTDTFPSVSSETTTDSTATTFSTDSTTFSTETTPSTDTTVAGGDADTWPDGTSGWTVILSSTSDQSEATGFRDRVTASGRAAGLIESSQYSSLSPGLWVVYSAVLTSRSAAVSSAASLRSAYPGAYAARIEPA